MNRKKRSVPQEEEQDNKAGGASGWEGIRSGSGGFCPEQLQIHPREAVSAHSWAWEAPHSREASVLFLLLSRLQLQLGTPWGQWRPRSHLKE